MGQAILKLYARHRWKNDSAGGGGGDLVDCDIYMKHTHFFTVKHSGGFAEFTGTHRSLKRSKKSLLGQWFKGVAIQRVSKTKRIK
jgi:hypothetical protein